MKKQTRQIVQNFPATCIVATKVSPTEKEVLQDIATRGKTTLYHLLRQMVVNLIRHGDTSHPLTREQKHLFTLFDKHKHNPTRRANKSTAIGAVYFVKTPREQQAVYFDGKATATQNIETILRHVLDNCCPILLQRIMHQAQALGNNSILLTLSELLATAESVENGEYIQTLFNANTLSENGRESTTPLQYNPANNMHPQKHIL